jgi:hypothetical protein
VVLTASSATEYSFETPTSEQPSQESSAPGSVFTAALIAGLRDGDADADGNGFITVDEAYTYAYGECAPPVSPRLRNAGSPEAKVSCSWPATLSAEPLFQPRSPNPSVQRWTARTPTSV